MKPFTIVFSNYTGWRFAWPGSPERVRPYLGNRVVLGSVTASDETEAMCFWTERFQGAPSATRSADPAAVVAR